MADLQGRKVFKVFNQDFIVDERYNVTKELGQGAYGIVCAATNNHTGEGVAIKKVTNVFSKKILAKRALREIKLLQHFRGHRNITCLYDMDIPRPDNFNETYLYEELMECDLAAIIRSGQPLTDAHFQSFIYQILCGLKYIHSANVLHRDLKPGNLLVNADCELKICDFGLARGFSMDPEENAGYMTEYVATRWYRAPEIMLSFQSYTKAIDVWSIGCILAELLGGRPFFKGRDYVDQLNQILHYLGTPNEETLSRIGSPRAQEYVRNLPYMPKVPFLRLFSNANPDALDLLDRMLAFDPSARISVEEALEHRYLHIWHDASDEPACATTFDFHFEVVEDVPEMRKMILAEVARFRQQVRVQQPQQQMGGQINVPIPENANQWSHEDPRPQEAAHSQQMHVKITLIPLEQDEKQNHRTITITVHNLSVRVGRASKNPSKGLLAAPDNAWFDYPILSRTHAKFTASLNQQEIYLQDCGSTHGTYIDKQRLETGVEFAVADGEVITFGQRVTSGAVTYPAKDFRVHSKWESRSEVQDSYSTTIMTTQRLVNTASISRPAFTNDFEHSSEPSREGSVQIAAPHRHTFSVPSSDDEVDTEDEEEEVQIASSILGGEEEISAATTPDRQAVGKAYNDTEGEARGSKTGEAPGETRGLNLKGPSLQDLLTKSAKDGTSQANPINLEGVYTDIIDVDTESEDDGPDVLPFSESTKADQPNRSKVWDEPQVGHQSYTVTMPTTMTVAEEQGDQNAKIQRHCIVPETQANVANEDEARGQEPRNVVAESTAGATDGFDSDDDDEFDYDHQFLDPFPEPTVLNYGKPNTSKPKVTFQVGSEKPHYKTLTPPFDEFRPIRLGHLSASDAIDVSQPTEPPSAWAQRAPSPSDAALARKASDPKTSLGRDIFDNFYVPPWPAAAKTTHSHSTEHAADTAAAREEHNGALSWPELQSPEPRLYDQGPFSSQPKVVIPVACAPKPDNIKDQSKKATVTWADPHEKNDTRIMITDCFAYTGKQASKITIPSLVEDYLAENPRSFKRKYGGMNGSIDVEDAPNAPNPSTPIIRTSGYKRTFAEANPVVSSYSLEKELSGTKWQSQVDPTDFTWDSGEANTTQGQLGLIDRDTPLPDAQPRENIFQTPNASISQDSVAEPAASSMLITKTGHGEGTEEPARKKARISSSSSGGIGKFVMGVGFGLLGAAAAFIATIPASVYEEALRELGNVA